MRVEAVSGWGLAISRSGVALAEADSLTRAGRSSEPVTIRYPLTASSSIQ